MLMLINLWVIFTLKRLRKKIIKIQIKPSSQTEKDESSTTQPGTNGKGKQESDAVASNTRTIETVTIARVTQCHPAVKT